MDAITVLCKKCEHSMRFSVEKAGKKAKCPKCESINVIQADEQIQLAPDVPPPEAPPAAPPKPTDDEDDGPANYGVYLDPELEERRRKLQEEDEAAAKKKKKNRKDLPAVSRKVKVIQDAASWGFVRMGMLFVFIGVWIWLACHLLQGVYLIIGSAEFPEYAEMIAGNLEKRNDEGMPPPGQAWDMDEMDVHLGMLAGKDFLSFARGSLILASVLYFFQAILWGIGYGCCLPVPRRFGMFWHVLILLGLTVVNMIVMLVFKALPIMGAHGYVLIPFVIPEIVLTEYNMERMLPIHVLWSSYPFWENVLSLILKFLFYLEPTFLSIFVWYAGVAIKDESVEHAGMGRVQMCLGTFFVLVCFHLLALAGASPPMVYLLRVLYTVWYLFMIMFMLQYAMMLLKFRAVLYVKINPKNELTQEDEPKKKKKKKD